MDTLGRAFVWSRKLLSFTRLQRLMGNVFLFARSPAPPGSPCVLDMTELLQWARHHWHRLMNGRTQHEDERPYSYSSLLVCGGKSSPTPKPAGKHRVVIPHLPCFKDEYERFSGTYMNNRIRTTKYTLLNFVPRNLFEQFHRYCGTFRERNISECSSFLPLKLPPTHALSWSCCTSLIYRPPRQFRLKPGLEQGCLGFTQFLTVRRTSSVYQRRCCSLVLSSDRKPSVAQPRPYRS